MTKTGVMLGTKNKLLLRGYQVIKKKVIFVFGNNPTQAQGHSATQPNSSRKGEKIKHEKVLFNPKLSSPSQSDISNQSLKYGFQSTL